MSHIKPAFGIVETFEKVVQFLVVIAKARLSILYLRTPNGADSEAVGTATELFQSFKVRCGRDGW